MSCHSTYVTAHSPTLLSLYLHHSSFTNPSVASPTSQLILQPFCCFSYITGSSLTSPSEPPMLYSWVKCLWGPLQHRKFHVDARWAPEYVYTHTVQWISPVNPTLTSYNHLLYYDHSRSSWIQKWLNNYSILLYVSSYNLILRVFKFFSLCNLFEYCLPHCLYEVFQGNLRGLNVISVGKEWDLAQCSSTQTFTLPVNDKNL